MRPPVPRVFASLNALRCSGVAVSGSGVGCSAQFSPLLKLGLLDTAPQEGLLSSLRQLPQERLPPSLAFTFLSHCWYRWSTTAFSDSVASESCGRGTEDSAVLETLLKVSEEALRVYYQVENREHSSSSRRETDPRAAKVGASRSSLPCVSDGVGHHHIVEHMLRICGDYVGLRAIGVLLTYAVTAEDSEGTVFKKLVDLLAFLCAEDALLFESNLRKVLAVCHPVHVAPVVISVLHQRTVSSSVLKLCMHHVAVVVRGRLTGFLAIENVLGGFHECAIMALRWLSENTHDGQWRHDLCVQVMSCLKHAPLFLLCSVYTTMEERVLLSPSVQCKFLANCGIATSSSGAASNLCGDAVIRAFSSLTRSGREAKYIEEGLVHGSAALVALKRADLVLHTYKTFPELRATPHLVMAHVHNMDVSSACEALLAVARTREEGWLNIPPPVMHVIYAVCLTTGRCGSSTDVVRLYRAVVSFHNPGIIVSQCLEHVLSGMCDRIASISGRFPKEAQPCTVLEHVIPLLRAVVTCIGDDVNSDMILELIEAAINVEHFAVPLTSSILWTLQRSSSLALKELFSRVGPSTNGIPFLNYYTLCYARDRGKYETVDHLATVWHCEAEPIIKRRASLAPSYKLWKCAACGRFNSDRFNYCSCSALRNGFVVCGKCSYAQDERLSFCQSCGIVMEASTIKAAVVRRAWSCSGCGASNPARQIIFCFRCKAQLGPVAKVLKEVSEGGISGCGCPAAGASAAVGELCAPHHYCKGCGWIREAWAAANSTVWRCEGCGLLRSSLDRTCPDCPHVDCLPFAVSHRSTDTLSCGKCGFSSQNPFSERCHQCDETLSVALNEGDSAVTTTGTTGGSLMGARISVWCSNCSVIVNDATAKTCTGCGHELHCTNAVRIAARHCSSCGNNLEPAQMGAMCSCCCGFVPPVPEEGWSVPVIRDTLKIMGDIVCDSVNYDVLVRFLRKLLTSFHQDVDQNTVNETRVAVVVAIGRLHMKLSESVPYEAKARRVVALTKQLLEHIDAVCGVASQHFCDGQCRHCLGTHKPELCSFTSAQWVCDVCGGDNENVDVCRYVCHCCLSLRGVVQEESPVEVWGCPRCQRANVVFESHCIFCGVQRAVVEKEIGEESEVLPFLPARCDTCNLIYLEARCPLCHRTLPDVLQEVDGVVCLVTNKYAFIQPVGTEHPSQRVYVGETWLRKRKWTKGERVTFTASLNSQGGFRNRVRLPWRGTMGTPDWLFAEMSGNLTWIKQTQTSSLCTTLFSVLSPTLIMGFAEKDGSPVDYIMISTVSTVRYESSTVLELHCNDMQKLLLVTPNVDECDKWLGAIRLALKWGEEERSKTSEVAVVGRQIPRSIPCGCSADTTALSPPEFMLGETPVSPVKRDVLFTCGVDADKMTTGVPFWHNPIHDDPIEARDCVPSPCSSVKHWESLDPRRNMLRHGRDNFHRQKSSSRIPCSSLEERDAHRDFIFFGGGDHERVHSIAAENARSFSPSMVSSTNLPSSTWREVRAEPTRQARVISSPHITAILGDSFDANMTNQLVTQTSSSSFRSISCPIVDVDDEKHEHKATVLSGRRMSASACGVIQPMCDTAHDAGSSSAYCSGSSTAPCSSKERGAEKVFAKSSIVSSTSFATPEASMPRVSRFIPSGGAANYGRSPCPNTTPGYRKGRLFRYDSVLGVKQAVDKMFSEGVKKKNSRDAINGVKKQAVPSKDDERPLNGVLGDLYTSWCPPRHAHSPLGAPVKSPSERLRCFSVRDSSTLRRKTARHVMLRNDLKDSRGLQCKVVPTSSSAYSAGMGAPGSSPQAGKATSSSRLEMKGAMDMPASHEEGPEGLKNTVRRFSISSASLKGDETPSLIRSIRPSAFLMSTSTEVATTCSQGACEDRDLSL